NLAKAARGRRHRPGRGRRGDGRTGHGLPRRLYPRPQRHHHRAARADDNGDPAMTTVPTSPRIADSDVERYQRNGAICLRGAFEREWIEVLARGFERNLAEPGPNAARYTPQGNPGGYIDDFCNWQRIAEYSDFVHDSPAAAIAGRLMGSRIARLFLEN